MPNKPWHQYMYSERILGDSTYSCTTHVCTYQWIECKSECCLYNYNYNILSCPNHTSVDDLAMTYTTISVEFCELSYTCWQSPVNYVSSFLLCLGGYVRVFVCVYVDVCMCLCVRVCVCACVFVCEYILFHYQLPTSLPPYHLSLPSWESA